MLRSLDVSSVLGKWSHEPSCSLWHLQKPELFQAGSETEWVRRYNGSHCGQGKVHILNTFLPPHLRVVLRAVYGFYSPFWAVAFSVFGISWSSNILKGKFGFFFFSLLNPCFQFFLNLTHKHCFKRYVTEAPNKDRLIFFLKYMWLKFETWLLPRCSLGNRKLAQERGCCSGGNAGGKHPAGGNADFHNLAPCMRDHPILSS